MAEASQKAAPAADKKTKDTVTLKRLDAVGGTIEVSRKKADRILSVEKNMIKKSYEEV